MKQFAALALSGLLASTMLVGCKEESKKSSSTEPQKTVSPQSGTYQQVPTNTSALPLGQRCHYDLCKDTAQQVPNIIATIQKAMIPSQAQEEYYKTYIEPQMTSAVQKLNQRSSLFLEILEQKEAGFSQATLNQIQMRLIYFLSIPKDNKKHPELIAYLKKDYAKLEFAQAFAVFQNMGKSSYFQKLYPSMDLKEAYEKELTTIQQLDSQLNKGLGIKLKSIPPDIAERIKAHQDLSVDDINELTETANNVRQIWYFALGNGSKALDQEMSRSPLQMADLIALYQNSSLKTDTRKGMESTAKLPEQCKVKFYQSINLYPQKSEVDRFQKLSEQTRQAALSLLSQNDPAYARISSVQINLPTTAEENTKSYLRMLSSKKDMFADDINELKAMSDSAFFTLVLLNALDAGDDGIDCDKLIPSAEISDSTLAADGFLRVSWFSVRYPQVGVSILAHELGHSVFAYSNSIEVTRQCLKSKKDNSDKYLNEDYADIFAAKTNVVLQNQFSIKTENFGCAFIYNLTNTSLLNMDPNDPHSSGLYRAIQVATHSGQALPESCQQMIQQGGFQSAGVVCQ